MTRNRKRKPRDQITTVARSVMPCGKVGYLNRKAARAEATKIERAQGVKLTPYRCDDERCAGMPWHLKASPRPHTG